MNSRVLIDQPPRHDIEWLDVTDWYIPDNETGAVVVHPGAIKAEGSLLECAKRLRSTIQWTCSQAATPPKDWQIDFNGITLRVHRQETVKGDVYMCRRMPVHLPNLDDLGLPDELLRLFKDERFAEQGGLVVVSGKPGHGKTTTVAAVILERVRAFGYFCLTVEDPSEVPMHGEYIASNKRIGQIIQVQVVGGSFSDGLRDALRCYPSSMKGTMLLVGEVRDGKAASQLLRAAANGQLVFTTMHAGEPRGALERLLSLAREEMGDEEAKTLLGMSLRGVLHQTLSNGSLSIDPLFSMSPQSSVANMIRIGGVTQLSSVLEAQKRAMKQGKLMEVLRGS